MRQCPIEILETELSSFVNRVEYLKDEIDTLQKNIKEFNKAIHHLKLLEEEKGNE